MMGLGSLLVATGVGADAGDDRARDRPRFSVSRSVLHAKCGVEALGLKQTFGGMVKPANINTMQRLHREYVVYGYGTVDGVRPWRTSMNRGAALDSRSLLQSLWHIISWTG